MHKVLSENEKLVFQYEVLRARLDIREFFLKTIVREIYENIGQMLSVVRMQLGVLNADEKESQLVEIRESGNIVGQSIRDLRNMCRSFYPDEDILQEGGFIEGLNNTIRILGFSDDVIKQSKDTEVELSPGLKLYVFKMLQEILISVEEKHGIVKRFSIVSHKDLCFNIDYVVNDNNTALMEVREGISKFLPFEERVKLIHGAFQIKRTRSKKIRITFKIPQKISI